MDPFVIIGAGVVLVAVVLVAQARLARARVLRGVLADLPLEEIAKILYDEYDEGVLYPAVLAKCAARKNDSLLPIVRNRMICLDVAAGRYREALEWHDANATPRDDLERLLLLNLAEALACLGRFEESLRITDWLPSNDFVRVGVASHRAWVLSELGRTTEARRVLEPSASLVTLLGPYQAEWYFSSFCIEFAEKNFDAAEQALRNAHACVQRESTRRNLSFLCGRLAATRGDHAAALIHFERGAHSPYQWQGGDALAHWAEMLTLLGRHEDARAVWHKCAAQDPQSPAGQRAKEKLSSSG